MEGRRPSTQNMLCSNPEKGAQWRWAHHLGVWGGEVGWWGRRRGELLVCWERNCQPQAKWRELPENHWDQVGHLPGGETDILSPGWSKQSGGSCSAPHHDGTGTEWGRGFSAEPDLCPQVLRAGACHSVCDIHWNASAQMGWHCVCEDVHLPTFQRQLPQDIQLSLSLNSIRGSAH